MTLRMTVLFSPLLLGVAGAVSTAAAVEIDLPLTVADWLREDNPDTDSNSLSMFVGSLDSGNALRGTIVVDLTSFTAGDLINSASLSVFHREAGVSNHRPGAAEVTPVSLHLSDEITANEVTWNSYDGVSSWATPGGDFGAPLVTVNPNLDTIGTNEEVVFAGTSLTSALQSAVTAGDDAIAFVLTAPDLETTGVRDFFAFAGDSPNAGELAPVLNLDFIPQFDIADVNRDGVVSALDFFQISDDLFKTDAELMGVNVNSDIDGSGLVDFADFRIWKNTPQGAAIAAAIPEPTSLLILGVASLFATTVRSNRR